jgi:hypothetical protein
MTEKQYLYWLAGIMDLLDKQAVLAPSELVWNLIKERHQEVFCRVIEDGTELR